MEAFAFSIAAFLELSAEPFAVCFLIERNAVLLPSVEFQRELLAVARLALWGVPYSNYILAIFEEAGYVMVRFRRMLSLIPSNFRLPVTFLSLI